MYVNIILNSIIVVKIKKINKKLMLYSYKIVVISNDFVDNLFLINKKQRYAVEN